MVTKIVCKRCMVTIREIPDSLDKEFGKEKAAKIGYNMKLEGYCKNCKKELGLPLLWFEKGEDNGVQRSSTEKRRKKAKKWRIRRKK